MEACPHVHRSIPRCISSTRPTTSAEAGRVVSSDTPTVASSAMIVWNKRPYWTLFVCAGFPRACIESPSAYSSILSNLGVPRPVTGSQPAAAVKPSQHSYGFEPPRMSVNMSGCAYKKGLMKPMGGRSAASNCALREAMRPAIMGEEHDVPPMPWSRPPMTTWTFSPIAEMSGYARVPSPLKDSEGIGAAGVPRMSKYPATASACHAGRA
mmetsp:Transcript_1978/g.7623  ORF Transcript_1978/g.7623 Transcript_1978/m.7623 type:complete len:210 (-) Transcript_1978:1154-1783(-)